MKRTIISLAILILTLLSASAQSVQSTYFLNEWSHRHTLNAAFAPEYGHLSLTILGGIQLNLASNTGLSNYLYHYNDGFTTFLHSSVNGTDFISKLNLNNTINQGINLSLLSFGFYTAQNSFWSFDVNLKQDLNINIPIDFFRLAKLGMEHQSNSFDLKNLYVNQTNIAEISLGYSRDINSKIRIGINAKLLAGLTSERIKYNQLDITLANNQYKVNASGESLIMAEFVSFDKDSNNYYDFTKNKLDISKLKPSGIGAAIDLGITYKPFKRLTLAAAVNDLGFLKWNASSIKRGVATSNVLFNGFTNINVDSLNVSSQVEQLKQDAGKLLKFKEVGSNENLQENIPYTLNLSGEFSVFANDNHDILLGMLYHSYNSPYKKVEEMVGAVTLKPFSWFTVSGTCELLNSNFNRYGLGINFSPKWINLYIASDYITPKVNHQLLPYEKFDLNLTFGGSLVLGKPKDSDKDGVVDRKDNCPQTPLHVLIDKKGCPIDSDGDGVPDYLDKCPVTPKEAKGMVDTSGCLLDTDGDGVPDYLDISPNTPIAARGFVDKQGSPMDTDKDGIADYLDKCANTPAGITVDFNGCPVDNDGDGVPDYLDLCPGTQPQARGMIDKNGCPLDTDGDGVMDYLDLCPNTAIEARGFVNNNGCLNDTDGDGVPDYIDKCPNTTAAAFGMIDNNGCPKDTDNDSIPDYLDKCPSIPGTVSNNGCPELKKEVKVLFQKALQGIQFEAGKTVIKASSFVILDQIAKVLNDNPTYIIEIRGHTDNVGKPEINLFLSENRAAAVRNYLVNKGIVGSKMTSKGFGDTQPVVPNNTKAGKAKNRRVEFLVSY
ncbi:MAG: DUF5723 family protein [Paludibacter sp.]